MNLDRTWLYLFNLIVYTLYTSLYDMDFWQVIETSYWLCFPNETSRKAKEAITKIEAILYSLGKFGGNVMVLKDTQILG